MKRALAIVNRFVISLISGPYNATNTGYDVAMRRSMIVAFDFITLSARP